MKKAVDFKEIATVVSRLSGCAPVSNPYAAEVGDIVVECSDLFSPVLYLYIGVLISTKGVGPERVSRIRSLADNKVRKLRNPYLKVLVRKQFADIAMGATSLQ